jgi:hypothetical protein
MDRTISLSLNTKIEIMMDYIRSKGMIQRYRLSESRLPKIPLATDRVIFGDVPSNEADRFSFAHPTCGHLWELGV